MALAVGCGHGQTPGSAPATLAEGLVIRSWGTEAGLPQNTVNAIVQSRDGYLWVGTRDGLARFDGVRFTVFGLSEGLPSMEVQTLLEDHLGTLWIGTRGGGLSRMIEGRIESVPVPQSVVGGDIVTGLAEDLEGLLWIGTLGGLSLWSESGPATNDAVATLRQEPIRFLARSRTGSIWIATATKGAFEFRDQTLHPITGPAGTERISAYCLLDDKQGDLWASIGNGTILCRRGDRWVPYQQSNGLPFAYVTSMTEETDGTIWAGSLDEGLYRFQDDRFTAVKTDQGLSANDIRSLQPDREGNLWVGTRTGGLNRVSRRKVLHCGAVQGLTNEFVRSVAELPDGTLAVGTIGGGLYQGTPRAMQPFSMDPRIRFYASVESVLAAADGTLWWGGARGLLHWADGKLAGCYTNEPWIVSAAVTALCDDRQGGVWIGTSESRLAHFQNGQFQEFRSRVARGPVTALACQPDGAVWVGSLGGGLKRIEPDGTSVFSVVQGLSSQAICTLYLDRDGTLWIGTAGGGLARWHRGRITGFTAQQGLGANTISQIVEDDEGHLWLGSNHGILRVHKADLEALADGRTQFLHPRAYGINDGMPAEECSSGFSPAGLKTRSGLVCFSTVKGLVLLDPRQADGDVPPPEVLMEETLTGGQPRPPEPGFEVLSLPTGSATDLPLARRVIVPPGGRDLELHYTGISFASPEKVRFRYKLEGWDPDWIEAGTRRTAYYHGIPPGEYVFRVMASNADNVWNEQGAALALTLQPYLWETRTFLVVASLLGIGLFAGGLRYAERRRYRRRLAVLETQHAIEKERVRISQDMHDHIGGMLTQVSILSDLGQSQAGHQSPSRGHFEKIGVQARAAVQGLDEIIWATNPKNDNLPRFAEYISRFADECFENTTLRCWQEMPPSIPEVPLRADLRHNLFLAIKEALNNALKHSNAANLWLRLSFHENLLRVEIEDDGRGFDPTSPATRGNGLGNLQHRLSDCGGRAEVSSCPGKGTRVTFELPLPPTTPD